LHFEVELAAAHRVELPVADAQTLIDGGWTLVDRPRKRISAGLCA
jgi:hypothetical protein